MDGDGGEIEVTPGEVERYEDGVAVLEHCGVVVLDGPQHLVDRLIAEDPALCARVATAPADSNAGGALALLSALVGGTGGQQVMFQLDHVGLAMFQQGSLAPTGDGFFRAFGRAADGTISGHAALKPLAVSPQQVLSAQMALTTLALTAAIKDVQAAVERVEANVEVLRALLDADRIGEIIGVHLSLTRRAEELGFDGSLSDVDWNAIDDVGIQVEQRIESLRSYVRKRLASAEDEGMRIAGRVDALEHVRELSETLSLLVVAQDNLFLFQQLRLARIRDTQPDRLDRATIEAQSLLAEHRRADQDLLERVRDVLVERVSVKALEIHRFMSARAVGTAAGEVDAMLRWFADQRSLRHDPVPVPPVPGMSDAWIEARGQGAVLARGTRRAIGGATSRVRRRNLERGGEKPGVVGTGKVAEALPSGDEIEAQPDLEPSHRSPMGRAKDMASRVRLRRGPDRGGDDGVQDSPSDQLER